MYEVKFKNFDIDENLKKYNAMTNELRYLEQYQAKLNELLNIKVLNENNDFLNLTFKVTRQNTLDEVVTEIDSTVVEIGGNDLQVILRELIKTTALSAQVAFDNFCYYKGYPGTTIRIIEPTELAENYYLSTGCQLENDVADDLAPMWDVLNASTSGLKNKNDDEPESSNEQ